MKGRVRLCPYYFVSGEGDAARPQLGGVLATINPAVSDPGGLQLAEVVEAGGLLSGAFGLGKGGQEQTGQNADNGNHDKQFDERERALAQHTLFLSSVRKKCRTPTLRGKQIREGSEPRVLGGLWVRFWHLVGFKDKAWGSDKPVHCDLTR